MNDVTLPPDIEARKKKGWVAALLNLVCPGLGYMYCNRNLLGIVAFLIAIMVFFSRYSSFTITLVLIIDGFLCAGRYNKNLLQEVSIEENKKD